MEIEKAQFVRFKKLEHQDILVHHVFLLKKYFVWKSFKIFSDWSELKNKFFYVGFGDFFNFDIWPIINTEIFISFVA